MIYFYEKKQLMFKFNNNILKQALTFNQFTELTSSFFEAPNPPKPYDNENYLNYTKSNARWSKRLTKKVKLSAELTSKIESINGMLFFILINEPWCGDGAFTQAFIHNLASVSKGKIDLKIILRDSNLNIMENYLTNGGMAIPKLVCLDENLKEIMTWGPRPKALKSQLEEWKKDAGFDNQAKIQQVYEWYIKDKNQSIETEFVEIFEKITN